MNEETLKKRVWLSAISFQCPFCEKINNFVFEVDRLTTKEADVRETDFNRLQCSCGKRFSARVLRFDYKSDIIIYDYDDFERENSIFKFERANIYLEDGIVSHPYDAYREAYAECSLLLSGADDNRGDDLIHRMVFTQSISAFEAYLAETLIAGVKHKTEMQIRLILCDKELKDKSIKLHDAIGQSDNIQNIILEHLGGLLYHNLGRISPLYKGVFGIQIFKYDETRELMERAIKLRHDCVHRNGRDKLGRKLSLFTTSYVMKIMDTIHDLVFEIEDQIPEPIEDEDAWMQDFI